MKRNQDILRTVLDRSDRIKDEIKKHLVCAKCKDNDASYFHHLCDRGLCKECYGYRKSHLKNGCPNCFGEMVFTDEEVPEIVKKLTDSSKNII